MRKCGGEEPASKRSRSMGRCATMVRDDGARPARRLLTSGASSMRRVRDPRLRRAPAAPSPASRASSSRRRSHAPRVPCQALALAPWLAHVMPPASPTRRIPPCPACARRVRSRVEPDPRGSQAAYPQRVGVVAAVPGRNTCGSQRRSPLDKSLTQGTRSWGRCRADLLPGGHCERCSCKKRRRAHF
jgi:hypothetical protein